MGQFFRIYLNIDFEFKKVRPKGQIKATKVVEGQMLLISSGKSNWYGSMQVPSRCSSTIFSQQSPSNRPLDILWSKNANYLTFWQSYFDFFTNNWHQIFWPLLVLYKTIAWCHYRWFFGPILNPCKRALSDTLPDIRDQSRKILGEIWCHRLVGTTSGYQMVQRLTPLKGL